MSTPLQQDDRVHGQALVALILAALGAVAPVAPGGPVRVAMVLAFTLFGPGCALMSFVRVRSLLVNCALALTASLTLLGLLTALMLWTHQWAPLVMHVVLVFLTAAVGLLRLAQDRHRASVLRGFGRPPRPREHTVPAALLTLAVGLWIWSLQGFDVDQVGFFGLTFALGPLFVTAIVLACSAFAVELLGPARRPVLTASGAVLVLIIWATGPILLRLPQYPFVYKHIGVADLFTLSGRVVDSGDLYQQWPSFFSSAAYLFDLLEVPLFELARWAPTFFMVLQILMVAAIARSFALNTWVTSIAVVVFSVSSWPQTNYFAPQAFAFTLTLGFVVILLNWLRSSPQATPRGPKPSVRRRLADAVLHGLPSVPPTTGRQRLLASAAACTVYFTITSTHQLTPFFVLVWAAVLTALGLVRPRSLILVLAVIAFGYTLAKEQAVSQFSFFSGFDIFENASGNVQSGYGTSGQAFSSIAVRSEAFFIWGTALLAAWSARKKPGGVLIPLVCGFSPFLFIFGANYGGEIIYRIYIFSLPWCALLIAQLCARIQRAALGGRHAVRTTHPRPVTVCVGAAVLSFLALATLQGTQGQMAWNHVSPESIAAARYFYGHAAPGSVLVQAAPSFPMRLDADYRYVNEFSATDPSLTDDERFLDRRFSSVDVPEVTGYVEFFPGTGHYFVLSEEMVTHVEYFGYLPGDSLKDLAEALRSSPEWRVFYSNDKVVIFERR